MRTRLRAMLVTLAAVIVLAITAGLWIVATGAYNVAATEEHWPITQWALSTLQEKSVQRRAAAPPVPIPTDSATLAHGFEEFHEMCVECHGAPGFDRGSIGKGMNPRPPRLERAAEEWTDGELFWITKHGIRLAGMPAFGETHDDQTIVALVGFIRQLENMTEEDYAERVRALQAHEEESEEGHVASPDDPDHEH